MVIGNPPYVRQEGLGEFKGYFQKHYQVYQGTADLYAYFIERGVSLLQEGGIFSYIVANKWMRANYGLAFAEMAERAVH
ncbi:Eco57I restriction-modification methylase domain-containing protein [Methanothrix soehngenii]|uniref:Eco57I restriction-modification methylase domain-containing protein n=1 Tax=Methanothrix soehngenii TaxID=2223 RepID=UPI00300C35D6